MRKTFPRVTESLMKKNKNIFCLLGDIGVFSFHPVKHIACGEGGMLTTNSKELYKKLMLLRTHGVSKENMEENHGNWYYEMQELGYHYRMTEIQASLGISQLKKINNFLKRRKQLAKNYFKLKKYMNKSELINLRQACSKF